MPGLEGPEGMKVRLLSVLCLYFALVKRWKRDREIRRNERKPEQGDIN